MNKKGLSDVVTNVLIILLAIAAIAIVWFFVRGFLLNQDLNLEFDSNLEIKKAEVLLSSNEINIIVRVLKKDVDKLRVVVYDSLGNTKIIDLEDSSLKQFQQKEFSFQVSELNGVLVKVEVYSIYIENGEEIVEKVGAEKSLVFAERESANNEDDGSDNELIPGEYETDFVYPRNAVVLFGAPFVSNSDCADWIDKNNILENTDNLYANKIKQNICPESGALVSNNFGFNIPSGAEIKGIQVEIERRWDWVDQGLGKTPAKDKKVVLIKTITPSVSISASNLAKTSLDWPSVDTVEIYGSSTELWGESSWTPVQVNNLEFGIALTVDNSGGLNNEPAKVDSMKIKVYYSLS